MTFFKQPYFFVTSFFVVIFLLLALFGVIDISKAWTNPSGNPTDGSGILSASGVGLNINSDIAINNKHAFRGSDAWLRLNQDSAFTSGVHVPGLFAPGSLNVGGESGLGNPGTGNAWITGSVGIGTTSLGSKLTANGIIHSNNTTPGQGGFKFPDGTIQTSTASNPPLTLATYTATIVSGCPSGASVSCTTQTNMGYWDFCALTQSGWGIYDNDASSSKEDRGYCSITYGVNNDWALIAFFDPDSDGAGVSPLAGNIDCKAMCFRF